MTDSTVQGGMAARGMMPGPWRCKNTARKAADGTDNYIEITPDGYSGWKGNQYLCVSGYGSPEDGLAMAAAPEMLQALKELLSLEPVGTPAAKAAYRRARNAVTKATGKRFKGGIK